MKSLFREKGNQLNAQKTIVGRLQYFWYKKIKLEQLDQKAHDRQHSRQCRTTLYHPQHTPSSVVGKGSCDTANLCTCHVMSTYVRTYVRTCHAQSRVPDPLPNRERLGKGSGTRDYVMPRFPAVFVHDGSGLSDLSLACPLLSCLLALLFPVSVC